uniref:protein-L-isoaspartate(D-aspartate) O-methyltransferase-like isoform X2 n=1 Tax=Myxine glutinosa TaxID=7769 RepID=UPI00358FFD77
MCGLFGHRWTTHGAGSQRQLVEQLQKRGILKSERVLSAMLATDRALYTDRSPYTDAPQPIGQKATISAPHMHAYALELLADHLRDGASILDVGSGSGFLTACFARMAGGVVLVIQVGSTGRVVGVEHVWRLARRSTENVRRDDPNLLGNGCLRFVVGDGVLGWAEGAPYDAIHVGAAACKVPPKLVQQLRNGGRLLVPVGRPGRAQWLTQVDKKPDGSVSSRKMTTVTFVPLTESRHSQ